MYRPKFQQKLTLAFIVLASALTLLTDPVSAQKGRSDRKSSSSSASKQQAPQSAPAPRARQSAPASRSQSSAPQSSRPSQPSARSTGSSPVIRNNSARAPVISQPSRNTTRITYCRSTFSLPTINSNVRRQTTGSISSGNSASSIQSRLQQSNTNSNNRINTRIGNTRIPSITTQQPVVSSNNRISSSISSRIGNPIGTQPPSTSTIRNQPTTSSTNRINSRISSIFGTERTSPPTVARQPAADLNNRISSSKSSSIGNIIGMQSNSTSRTRKLSTTNQTNRNRSIIDSVKGPERTPPSSVAEQPAGSLRNLKSSIDRADSSIGSVIGPRRTPPPNATQQPAAGLNNRTISSRSRDIGNTIGSRLETTSRTRKQISNLNLNRETSRLHDTIKNRNSTQISSEPVRERDAISGSRIMIQPNSTRANRKAQPEQQTTIINNIITDRDSHRSGDRIHRFETVRPSRLIYRDRPYSRNDNYHYEHTYVDSYSRIRRKLIWPRYNYIVRYNWGPWFSYRYFYPYYHRKYVFVSLGGYWPYGYDYLRYYWYGFHPYYWYGYDPIAREVQTGTYNYYTYNYYYGDNGQGYASTQTSDSEYFDNLARQQAEPAQVTLADSYFDEAVKAFEDGNYGIAIDKFAKARELAPDDMVLPFAYCQALLAAERYSEAAQILREALKKVSPENEGVFFPRGLYSNEDILLAQLDELAAKAEAYSFDADLQLLLGYQLLGIGEHDKAVTPLINASLDLKNAQAAGVLLKLLEKIKTSDEETQETDTQEVQMKEAEMSSLIPSQSIEPITEVLSQQVQSDIVNEKHATKIKETVLVATLCVLAGSTGIGHYFRT
jgi:hypothetical protein